MARWLGSVALLLATLGCVRTPLPPPPGSDVRQINEDGSDVPALEPFAVKGKLTIFDFYARWCDPCHELDRQLYAILQQRSDVAVRKIDIDDWDSAVSRHYLSERHALPFLVLFDGRGQRMGSMLGATPRSLNRALEAADHGVTW
jgi:thiol-disulfide isomerase/thioredoxin